MPVKLQSMRINTILHVCFRAVVHGRQRRLFICSASLPLEIGAGLVIFISFPQVAAMRSLPSIFSASSKKTETVAQANEACDFVSFSYTHLHQLSRFG